MLKHIQELRDRYNLAILPEDEIVTNPKLGAIYHLSWASKRGMKWRLMSVNGPWAYMETPRTKKPLTAKVADLREINSVIVAKAKRRIRKKAMYILEI